MDSNPQKVARPKRRMKWIIAGCLVCLAVVGMLLFSNRRSGPPVTIKFSSPTPRSYAPDFPASPRFAITNITGGPMMVRMQLEYQTNGQWVALASQPSGIVTSKPREKLFFATWTETLAAYRGTNTYPSSIPEQISDATPLRVHGLAAPEYTGLSKLVQQTRSYLEFRFSQDAMHVRMRQKGINLAMNGSFRAFAAPSEFVTSSFCLTNSTTNLSISVLAISRGN